MGVVNARSNMYFAKYFKPIMRYLVGLNKPEIIAPAIIQPLIILFSAYVIPNSILLISATLAIALITSMYLAKNELRSHFLYYWTVLSMSYTIIVFEFVIVPLAEISPNENYFLILFTVLTLFFLYLTTISSSISSSSDKEENNAYGESLLNGNSSISICPACRIKMDPRNYHCNICQECIPKYDHHSYWLNCCIGDSNFHYYVAGVFFGVFALAYASLLILTTICSPDFFWGILLPEDCTDVCSNIE